MADAEKTIPPDIAALPFEKSLEELEMIVEKMEREALPLEALLNTFERGNYLALHCRQKLESLEKRIEILNENVQGESQWQEFKS